MRHSALVVMLLCMLSGVAQAAPITYELSGTATRPMFAPGGSLVFAAGAPVSWELQYDPSTPNSCPRTTVPSALYFGFTAMSLNIGGVTFHQTFASEAGSIEYNTEFGDCGHNEGPLFRFFMEIPSIPLLDLVTIPNLSLDQLINGLPPDIGPFLSTGYEFVNFGPSYFPGFAITEVTAVPEPSTMALLGTGILAAVWRSRKPRKLG